MDLLSEVLQMVKLRGTVYFHARFQYPWGMNIPNGVYANFHIVTKGSCWLKINSSGKALNLQKGDMVLFPRGDSHALVDSLQSPIVSANELLSNAHDSNSGEIIYGGDGSQSASLICGHFEYEKYLQHPLFQTLPEYIYISRKLNNKIDWFATASELAIQISATETLGADAVINRLSESLFIQSLAVYLDSLDNPELFLAAMQDKHIGKVLQAIHDDISHDWNVNELANLAFMSKSVFSEKFSKMVGEPPIVYLARWRMMKAKDLLTNTNLTLATISQKVGYGSEFSFAKAFKKLTGQAPGMLRKK